MISFFIFRPDIAALRTMPTPRPTPALEDLEAAPRRQGSVDAEAIRIVIHDVDSGPAAAAQKRVILRRDPTDKAHRSKINFLFCFLYFLADKRRYSRK